MPPCTWVSHKSYLNSHVFVEIKGGSVNQTTWFPVLWNNSQCKNYQARILAHVNWTRNVFSKNCVGCMGMCYIYIEPVLHDHHFRCGKVHGYGTLWMLKYGWLLRTSSCMLWLQSTIKVENDFPTKSSHYMLCWLAINKSMMKWQVCSTENIH